MGTTSISAQKELVEQELITSPINQARADLAAFRTTFNGHTHTGATAGAVASGAGPAAISLTCSQIPGGNNLSDNEKLEALKTQWNLFKTDYASLKTQFNAHTHAINAGAATTSAGTTIAAITAAIAVDMSSDGWEEDLNAFIDYYNTLQATLVTINTTMGAHTHLGTDGSGIGTSGASGSAAGATQTTLTLVP